MTGTLADLQPAPIAEREISEAEMIAWNALIQEVQRQHHGDEPGNADALELVRLIDVLIDVKIKDALWQMAQDIEASIGVLP